MKEKGPIAHLRLPLHFDEKKLLDDFSQILDDNWKGHFNTYNYSGEWDVIPLYAPNGDSKILFINPNNDLTVQETPFLKKCHYFKQIIDSFQVPIISARLLRLRPGADIRPHRDHNLGYEDHTFRVHIPILTNDKIKFILNDEFLVMKPGECWYTNVNYIHSVKNNGTEDRIHLVIDGKRNEWSDQLFFSLAPEEDFVPTTTTEYSPEVMQQMIESLNGNDSPAALNLIQELKTKLGH